MLHRKVSGSRSSSTLSSEKHQPVGLIYVLWLLFWNVKFRQMVVNSRTRIRNSVYHDVVDTLNNSHGDTITTTPQHYGDHSIPLGGASQHFTKSLWRWSKRGVHIGNQYLHLIRNKLHKATYIVALFSVHLSNHASGTQTSSYPTNIDLSFQPVDCDEFCFILGNL